MMQLKSDYHLDPHLDSEPLEFSSQVMIRFFSGVLELVVTGTGKVSGSSSELRAGTSLETTIALANEKSKLALLTGSVYARTSR